MIAEVQVESRESQAQALYASMTAATERTRRSDELNQQFSDAKAQYEAARSAVIAAFLTLHRIDHIRQQELRGVSPLVPPHLTHFNVPKFELGLYDDPRFTTAYVTLAAKEHLK